MYAMLYTCKTCDTRSARQVSKRAFHEGLVIVRCPGCDTLHLIADNIGWVEDEAKDVRDLVAPSEFTSNLDGNVVEMSAEDVALLRREIADKGAREAAKGAAKGPDTADA